MKSTSQATRQRSTEHAVVSKLDVVLDDHGTFQRRLESLKKELADLKVKVSTLAKSQRKEMCALKLENLQLSDTVDDLNMNLDEIKQLVSTLAKSQTKEMCAHKLENLQISDKVDDLNMKLDETKQLLNIEMRKSSGFRQTVDHLKKAFNRTLVSGHQTRSQALTLTYSPATCASSMVPVGKKLSEEEKKRLKDMSSFHVEMTRFRTIQARDIITLNRYGTVDEDSEFIDEETGIYTTPVKGTYGFVCDKYVKGKGDVVVYLCGGDGRRKRMEGGPVEWVCPEGLTAWLQFEGGQGCEDTVFVAGFSGSLILSRPVLI